MSNINIASEFAGNLNGGVPYESSRELIKMQIAVPNPRVLNPVGSGIWPENMDLQVMLLLFWGPHFENFHPKRNH
jgi:hypothetical protein